ncbi:MAG: type I restriction endonuclease subunit R, EcoR124 family, partial [Patescibacteria group bacterium]
YYNLFKTKNVGHNPLKIATIFTYQANDIATQEQSGFIVDDLDNLNPTQVLNPIQNHQRDVLETCMQDYNRMFGTNYNTKDDYGFDKYNKDISLRMKNCEIDVLLVVNMYLTGFDCKKINTLYVDKNLKQHGLIQAYSRTNRILNKKKSHGNIIVFRNLKKYTDEALELFSNKDAMEDIILKPYEEYQDSFISTKTNLIKLVPSPSDVDRLDSESEKLSFIKTFRTMLRDYNVIKTFSDFSWDGLEISENTFLEYQTKYKDLKDSLVYSEAYKESILSEIDFETELTRTDIINVDYILNLVGNSLISGSESEKAKTLERITLLISSSDSLRPKAELIKEFIKTYSPNNSKENEILEDYQTYQDIKKEQSLIQMTENIKLDLLKTRQLIDNYYFNQKNPLQKELLELHLGSQPTLLERRGIADKIFESIKKFVNIFYT